MKISKKEEDLNAPSIDDLFKIITLDPVRKVKITIELRDNDGDIVPVKETIEKITEYVSDKLVSEETNPCRQQIIPLMAQAVVAGMLKLTGKGLTTVILSHEMIRFSLIHMMTVSFYLLKWIQNKEIKIYTSEEPITQEEIDIYYRIGSANNALIQAITMGADPKDVLRQMIKNGIIKASDLAQMGAEGVLEEDDQDDEDKGDVN